MKWNVFYHDFNGQAIKKFNIFDHYDFKKDVERDLHQFRSRDEFAKSLKRHLFYYFCSKCEWEVLISPWVGVADTVKIDVYNQVMLNWDIFVDYCWTH